MVRCNPRSSNGKQILEIQVENRFQEVSTPKHHCHRAIDSLLAISCILHRTSTKFGVIILVPSRRYNLKMHPLPRDLGEAKPGAFQTRVFPTFFGKGPDCVADPFGTVPRRCS